MRQDYWAWRVEPATKHYGGPSGKDPHPDGSPQTVHRNRRAGRRKPEEQGEGRGKGPSGPDAKRTPHSAMEHLEDEYASEGGILDKYAEEALGISFDESVERLTEDLENFRESHPEEYEASLRWYEDAQQLARDTAEKYGVTEEQVAGILSATSAGSEWETQNQAGTESFLGYVASNPTVTVTRSDVDKFAKMGRKVLHREDEFQAFVERMGDQDEIEVPLLEIPASMAPSVKEVFDAMMAPGFIKPRYFSVPMMKSIRMLNGEDVWETLGGPKQRSFAWNILHPEDPHGVTIDVWMLRAISGDPRVGLASDDPVWEWKNNVTGETFAIDGDQVAKLYMGESGYAKYAGAKQITSKKNEYGMYPWHSAVVESVAENMGITPNDAQAALWVYYRNINPMPSPEREVNQ